MNDIKDTNAKDKEDMDQKLGQVNQDMNDLNGAMKMRVKNLADDLNDTIKDFQNKNEKSLQGNVILIQIQIGPTKTAPLLINTIEMRVL